MNKQLSIDITKFHKHNISDSCAITNLLSSIKLYKMSIHAKCVFYLTMYVEYECLYKKPKRYNEFYEEFQKRLKNEIQKGKFNKLSLSIDDLQDIEILTRRKKISKGELSSMILAKKYNQAFLTDDQGARTVACEYLDKSKVQTIPHLFGWLIYNGYLNDIDKEQIINEHLKAGRPLKNHLEDAYYMALEQKLATGHG